MENTTVKQLKAYLAAGYLQECYTCEAFSVYYFLKKVHVGFLHDADKASAPVGILLTKAEAELLSCTDSRDALRFLSENDAGRLVFSEELFKKCRSFFGKWSILRSIQKQRYYEKDSNGIDADTRKNLRKYMVPMIIEQNHEIRKGQTEQYNRCLKRVKVLGFIALCSVVLGLVCLGTLNLRKAWDPEKTAVEFDKNGKDEVYSSVEIDFLTPLTGLHPSELQQYDNSSYGVYYLFGNTQTKEYGITKFSEAYQEQLVVPEDGTGKLDTPIRIYGLTKSIPAKVKPIKKEPVSVTPPTTTTMVLPDGTKLEIPVSPVPEITVPEIVDPLAPQVNDYSEEALSLFSEAGFPAEGELLLGAMYLEASTTPHREKTLVNQVLDNALFVFLAVALLLLIPLILCGIKTDAEAKVLQMLNQGSLMPDLVNWSCPVTVSGQRIRISTKAFNCWLRFRESGERQYEFLGVLELTEAQPVIELWEDDVRTRCYCLQTEEGEDFTGKYFHVSVRLGLQGAPLAPTAQIDGFIADTENSQSMTRESVGYRMEGHFLRCGGEVSEQRRERNRGKDLVEKGLKYPGYTTPSNIRLIGICPDCGQSFTFHGYAFYMMQEDVAYSDDGLDVCRIPQYDIDRQTWSYQEDGKTFRYENAFCCPHCGSAYIDYKTNPQSKVFGVSACTHIGRKVYVAK